MLTSNCFFKKRNNTFQTHRFEIVGIRPHIKLPTACFTAAQIVFHKIMAVSTQVIESMPIIQQPPRQLYTGGDCDVQECLPFHKSAARQPVGSP